jgi:Recombinase
MPDFPSHHRRTGWRCGTENLRRRLWTLLFEETIEEPNGSAMIIDPQSLDTANSYNPSKDTIGPRAIGWITPVSATVIVNKDFLLHQLLSFRGPESSWDTKHASRVRRGPPPGTAPVVCDRTDIAVRVLNQIRDRRIRGEGFSAIAATLNGQGYRGRKGGRWYGASVRRFYQQYSHDGDQT